MNASRDEYSFHDLPELEEAEFDFVVPTCRRIQDDNDPGHFADSISIALDIGDEFSQFDA